MSFLYGSYNLYQSQKKKNNKQNAGLYLSNYFTPRINIKINVYAVVSTK